MKDGSKKKVGEEKENGVEYEVLKNHLSYFLLFVFNSVLPRKCWFGHGWVEQVFI